MLPILPFALLLIGMAFVKRVFFRYFFFCVLILYNFISSPLRTDSTAADTGGINFRTNRWEQRP